MGPHAASWIPGPGGTAGRGWWEGLAGAHTAVSVRQPSPAISHLDPCSGPFDPLSTPLHGLPEHMPFFRTSSWKAVPFLFHLLEAMQEGGKNLRLGLGRFKT